MEYESATDNTEYPQDHFVAMRGRLGVVSLLLLLPYAALTISQVASVGEGIIEWSSSKQISSGVWFQGSSYSWLDVSVTGEEIYAAWMDGRDHQSTDYDIYFTSSQDGGATWSEDRGIDTHGAYSSLVRVGFEGGFVHVFVNEGQDIYHLRSPDRGLSWTTRLIASSPGPLDNLWGTAVDSPFVYLAWSSRQNSGEFEIWFLKSADHGDTWNDPVRVWSGSSPSTHAFVDVSSSGNTVYIVFDGGFLKSRDGGDNWDQINTAIQGVDVEAEGSNVYVSTGNAYGIDGFVKSDDDGTTWHPTDYGAAGWIATSRNIVYAGLAGNYSVSLDYGDSFHSGNIPGVTPFDPRETDLAYMTSAAADSGTVHVILFQAVSREYPNLEIFYQKLTVSGRSAPPPVQPPPSVTPPSSPVSSSPPLWQQYWLSIVAVILATVGALTAYNLVRTRRKMQPRSIPT